MEELFKGATCRKTGVIDDVPAVSFSVIQLTIVNWFAALCLTQARSHTFTQGFSTPPQAAVVDVAVLYLPNSARDLEN